MAIREHEARIAIKNTLTRVGRDFRRMQDDEGLTPERLRVIGTEFSLDKFFVDPFSDISGYLNEIEMYLSRFSKIEDELMAAIEFLKYLYKYLEEKD